MFPAVLNLPSLTPEAESCDLLAAAYPALFDMAGLEDLDSEAADDQGIGVGPGSTNDQKASHEQHLHSRGFSEAQRKLLDKLVREGIMVGYHHAKQHVRLVDFFCQTLRRLVSGMGILSVKYLKVCPSFIYTYAFLNIMVSSLLLNPREAKLAP